MSEIATNWLASLNEFGTTAAKQIADGQDGASAYVFAANLAVESLLLTDCLAVCQALKIEVPTHRGSVDFAASMELFRFAHECIAALVTA